MVKGLDIIISFAFDTDSADKKILYIPESVFIFLVLISEME